MVSPTNRISQLGQPKPKKERDLSRPEKEEWFQRNLRGYEALRNAVSKDLLKENTNIHTKMKIKEQEASKLEENEIDPIFCKAYGVMYNPDRSKEVFMSSAKAE